MKCHSPEPWSIFEIGENNVHFCLAFEGGRKSILTMVDDSGDSLPAVFKDDDARRIVACVNACEGIDTETLEFVDGAARQAVSDIAVDVSVVHEARKQRDELLSALELMVLIHDEPSGFEGKFGKDLDDAISAQKEKIDARLMVARAAIAKAKGGAA